MLHSNTPRSEKTQKSSTRLASSWQVHESFANTQSIELDVNYVNQRVIAAALLFPKPATLFRPTIELLPCPPLFWENIRPRA